MNRSTRIRTIPTSHGPVAVQESGQGRTTVLFIHGNSSCRDVFNRQFSSQLADCYRLIALDLPGHGQSGDALDPMRSYTLPGLADAVAESAAHLGLSDFVIVGWSLGGHIGIELMQRCPGLKGLMITGTPPVRRGGMSEGFIASPHFQLASRPALSDLGVDAFAMAMFGEPVPPFLRDAIARTDTRFRQRLFEARRQGAGVDQRAAVESSELPLAVINGTDDRLINLDYFDTVAYRNLWNGRCYRLDGVGHAPFWHAADEFNALLDRFLDDIGQMRGNTRSGASFEPQGG
jgi:pimeloyl-ACP methyl ester carboxylesterase